MTNFYLKPKDHKSEEVETRILEVSVELNIHRKYGENVHYCMALV